MAEKVNKLKQAHDALIQDVIEQMAQGNLPWRKPWNLKTGIGGLPINAVTKNRYRGSNLIFLSIVQEKEGYKDPRWMTYNQAKSMGAHVRKGEKGCIVEYWMWEKEALDEDGNKIKVKLEKPVPLRSVVFNAEQIDGLKPYVPPVQKWELEERAERIIESVGVPVLHTAEDQAYYTRNADEIHLPEKVSFPNQNKYYATALHELSHATGHPSRLNREFGAFGSEKYAIEELRAEIGSMFLCRDLGIAMDSQDVQHAAYIQSWISILKKDPDILFKAAADAEKICDFIYGKEKELLKEQKVAQAVDEKTEALNAKLNKTEVAVLLEETKAKMAMRLSDGRKPQGPYIKNEYITELTPDMAKQVEVFDKCKFYKSDLSALGNQVRFKDCDFHGCVMPQNLSDKSWSFEGEKYFVGIDFAGTDLKTIDLSGSNMLFCSITDANLQGTDLSASKFTNCLFGKSNITNMNVSGSVFQSVEVANNTGTAKADIAIFAGNDTVKKKIAQELGLNPDTGKTNVPGLHNTPEAVSIEKIKGYKPVLGYPVTCRDMYCQEAQKQLKEGRKINDAEIAASLAGRYNHREIAAVLASTSPYIKDLTAASKTVAKSLVLSKSTGLEM